MSTVNFVMNRTYAYEVLNFNVPNDIPRRDLMRVATEALAREILSNGCLIHKSEYDIQRDATHEVFTVLCGKPDTRKLP